MGVWIETRNGLNTREKEKVTPCVGVWIETELMLFFARYKAVTPCVGVWIETTGSNGLSVARGSHPAWVCGLKQIRKIMNKRTIQSHPAWVCGLKQKLE